MNALQAMLAKKKALSQGLDGVQPRAGEASPSPTDSQPGMSVKEFGAAMLEAVDKQDSSQGTASSPLRAETEVKAEESIVESRQPLASSPLLAPKKLLSTPKPPVKTPNIIDSNKLAMMVKPELTVEALASSDGVIDDPHQGDRFKLTLDVLDAKLEEIGGKLDGFSIDTVRSIIARIMTDLKNHPDYESLYLGDRDVHNIMSFMYAVREAATEQNAKKVVKAEKTGSKKATRVNMAAALDAISMDDLKL